MPEPIVTEEQILDLIQSRKPAENLVRTISGGANAILPKIANLHSSMEEYKIALRTGPAEEEAAVMAVYAKELRDSVIGFLGSLSAATDSATALVYVLEDLAAMVPEPEEPEE